MTKGHGLAEPPLTVSTVIVRGLRERCPRCGRGKLFRAYLKPVDACGKCHERLGHIHADDGPAWLTILVTGHIVVPLVLALSPYIEWPAWAAYLLWAGLSLTIVLGLLPRCKGVFIGLIWYTKGPGSELPQAQPK